MNREGQPQPGVLYVSDLDGTLLGDDAALSPWTFDVLRELLVDGLPFTVASARSAVSIRRVLRGLPLRLPIIEFNGGFLTDLDTGRHVWVNAIESQVARRLHDEIRRQGHWPLISTFDGRRDRLYHDQPRNPGTEWYLHDLEQRRDERLTPVADVRVGLDDQVVCLTVIGDERPMRMLGERLRSAWPDDVCTYCMENLYSPEWYWLTVHARRATKQDAVQRLIAQYELGEVELVVFGDNDNDIGLFEVADRALAVTNAADELIRLASSVIGTNVEDSVARFIQADWIARAET